MRRSRHKQTNISNLQEEFELSTFPNPNLNAIHRTYECRSRFGSKQLRNQAVQGSDIGQKIACPDGEFSRFPSVHSGAIWGSTSNHPRPLPFTSFPINQSSNNSAGRHYVASANKRIRILESMLTFIWDINEYVYWPSASPDTSYCHKKMWRNAHTQTYSVHYLQKRKTADVWTIRREVYRTLYKALERKETV